MEVGQHVRQGDVFMMRVAGLPEKVKRVKRSKGRHVLALGEVTGHAHVVIDEEGALASLWTDDLAKVFLQVDAEGALLTHEEHDTIALPPGVYERRIQREYAPEGIRSVAD